MPGHACRIVAALLALTLCGHAQAAPVDLGQFLSSAIGRCWNPPPNATGSVTVRFDLNQDGTISGVPRVIGLASACVAKSAVHAIDFCAPYHLPPERYTDGHHASVTLSTG